MQEIESSTHIRALENELQAGLLVSKKQCFESSNKIITLECIIAESDNEKQRMMDEYHQVGIVCLFFPVDYWCFKFYTYTLRFILFTNIDLDEHSLRDDNYTVEFELSWLYGF